MPTVGLRVLFVLVVLAHHRRRVVHFNVTEHPTAHWTAQQIVDAFPNDSAPSYLLRDRDHAYGLAFRLSLPFNHSVLPEEPRAVGGRTHRSVAKDL